MNKAELSLQENWLSKTSCIKEISVQNIFKTAIIMKLQKPNSEQDMRIIQNQIKIRLNRAKLKLREKKFGYSVENCWSVSITQGYHQAMCTSFR